MDNQISENTAAVEPLAVNTTPRLVLQTAADKSLPERNSENSNQPGETDQYPQTSANSASNPEDQAAVVRKWTWT